MYGQHNHLPRQSRQHATGGNAVFIRSSHAKVLQLTYLGELVELGVGRVRGVSVAHVVQRHYRIPLLCQVGSQERERVGVVKPPVQTQTPLPRPSGCGCGYGASLPLLIRDAKAITEQS